MGVRVAVVALAVVAGSTACGEGTARLSESDWVAAADAICRRTDAKTNAAAVRLGPSPTPAQLERFVDELAPEYQKQIDAIRDLRPPRSMKDDVDAMLNGADKALGKVERASGEELVDMLAPEDDPFEEVNRMAARLGLKDCSG